MDIAAAKLELIKLLLNTNDVKIIEAIKNVFESNKKNVWDALSTEEQEAIDFKILEENRGDQVEL
jgi:hypothetical protein